MSDFSSDKSTVLLKADDPNLNVLIAKLEYHRAQVKFHQKQQEELEKLIEFLTRVDYTKKLEPDTVGLKSDGVITIDVNILKKVDFWRDVAGQIIKDAGILMQTSDLFNAIKSNVSEAEKRNVMSKASLALTSLWEEGKLKRHKKEGDRGFYYGTPEMFDGETPIVEF